MTIQDVLRALPDIATLRDRCRALAVLDAILSPQPEWRYHTYTAHWAPGEELASMDNGSGDSYSIVFSAAGAFIRGLDHESPMSPAGHDADGIWPGLVETVPEVFRHQLREPAFCYGGGFDATVCLWRQAHDDRWHAGDIDFPDDEDDGGADYLLGLLTEGTPEAYVEWAGDYYERPVDLVAVRRIWALDPLSDELVRRLDPTLTPADLAKDLARVGYP